MSQVFGIEETCDKSGTSLEFAHVVFLHAYEDYPPPTSEQVAERTQEDQQTERREQLNTDFIQSLLSRYTMIFEGEDSTAAPETAQ